MRERRELYPEGESPAIPKPEVTPNSVLDDPKLFELQASSKANIKEFSFRLFGRTFRFETYTIKEVHKISDCDEIMCSNEAIMERVLKDNLSDDQKIKLTEMFENKNNVYGPKVKIRSR